MSAHTCHTTLTYITLTNYYVTKPVPSFGSKVSSRLISLFTYCTIDAKNFEWPATLLCTYCHWPLLNLFSTSIDPRYDLGIVYLKKRKKKKRKKEHGQQRNNKNKNSIPIHTNPTNATRTHDVTRSLTQC